MLSEVLAVNNNADNIIENVNDNNTDKARTIEDNFTELELIIKDMQSEDITLDTSFDLYRKGLKLVQDCNNQIDTIEKKIKILDEDDLNE